MAYTQDDIDKLKAAIAAGAVLQSFTFADQTFTFRSIAEMVQVLAMMEGDVAAADGTRTTHRYAATSKGV